MKQAINKEIIRNARNRTQTLKEFPTLRLFWELGGEYYNPKAQEYIKINKHRIDVIRYIFKMRIGCDGSRETLHIRKLIGQ